ncbi:transposase [Candidatus Poribacteria bacterium]|nr:transposase [Candidatus Poribacteria bacterium]
MKKKHNRKKEKRQGKSARFAVRASLIAVGQFIRQWKLLSVIEQKVTRFAAPKTVQHTPFEKVTDALIAILAGANGLCELNKRLRSDRMLQLAFGRAACAEQSTVSQTINAVTTENVAQMRDSLITIYQKFSRGFRHDDTQRLQLLGVDLSGLPCGEKAELASQGYFAKQKNRRGRQIGRVVGTHLESQLLPSKPPLRDRPPRGRLTNESSPRQTKGSPPTA